MIHPEYHRRRNVWFLDMGARESKVKSPPRTSGRGDRGSGSSTVSSGPSIPLRSVQPAGPEPDPVWPENSVRWESEYDVYICHSKEEADCTYAMEMLSYLEQQPEKLRCFFPMRDMLPGSPIPSEMCSGLQSSHCWVMLLTPHFLSDGWCKYQMHQSLTQAPYSNGRLIPVMVGLTLGQYPSEMKHMYAYKGALSDKSIFTKIRGAVLTYLKEMINVTSDRMPVYSPRNKTPERSQSASVPVGNSQEESLETKETTSDMPDRTPILQETTDDMPSRTPISEETTSDMPDRTPILQETTDDISSRTPISEETTSDMPDRTPISEETTGDMPSRTPILQETTGDMPNRTPISEETTNDLPDRTPISEETTSDMSMRTSVTGLETSDVSPRTSKTEEATTEFSLGSLLSQDTTRDMSIRSSETRLETATYISSGSPLNQQTTSNVSLKSLVSEETIGNVSIKSSVTTMESTIDMPNRTPVSEDISRDISLGIPLNQETISDLSMRSTMTEQETTGDHSLSPPLISNRDTCTEYEHLMLAAKDSFSQETRINTSDSGVWSMTMDLHTDHSDMSMRSSMSGQESTSNLYSRTSMIEETTSYMSMRSSDTRREATSDMPSRTPLMVETTSDMSVRSSVTGLENTSDVSFRSPLTQETTSDCSSSPPLIKNRDNKYIMPVAMDSFSLEKRINTSDSGVWSMTIDLDTDSSDTSMRSFVAGQRTTSNVVCRTSMTPETTGDLSMRSSETRLETTSNLSMRSSETRLETTSNESMRRSETRQETTSDMPSTTPMTAETIRHMTMNSSMTRLETTSDVSSRGPLTQETTSDCSSSLPLNNRDVCIDHERVTPAAKDSFSQESRIDSGVWSMTTDLHTDCSDICTSDVQNVSMHSHRGNV